MTMNTDPSALAWMTSLSATTLRCAPPPFWHLWRDATSRCCRHSFQDRKRRVMCLMATVSPFFVALTTLPKAPWPKSLMML